MQELYKIQKQGLEDDIQDDLNKIPGLVSDLAQTTTLVEKFAVDSETDDTEKLRRAIQHCKDNGLKRLFLSKNLIINSTVIIDVPYLTLYSDTTNDIMATISSEDIFVGDTLLDVKADGVSFNGIGIDGDNDTTMTLGTLIGIRFDYDNPDLDSFITNCKFTNLKYGVVAKGRNIRIENSNTFSLTNFPIDLYKHPTGNVNGDDIRGVKIKRNIFHTCGMYSDNPDFACLLTVNDCTNKQDIDFSDNLIEQGVNRLFKGHYHGLKFNDNNCINAFPSPYAIEFLDKPVGVTNIVLAEVEGNNIRGGANTLSIDPLQETVHFIKGNVLKHISIKDNKFNVSTNAAIYVSELVDSEVKDNVFRDISYENTGVYNIIHASLRLLNTPVTGNSFLGNFYKYAIYMYSSISNSPIEGNSYPSEHTGINVWVESDQGAKFVKKFDTFKETYESMDTRPIFGQSLSSLKEYKRVNPDNANLNTVIATERIATDDFTSADKTKVNSYKEVKVMNEGVLQEKLRIDKDGVKATGYLRVGNGWLWVDANGKLRVATWKPTSDTDGTIVGTQA